MFRYPLMKFIRIGLHILCRICRFLCIISEFIHAELFLGTGAGGQDQSAKRTLAGFSAGCYNFMPRRGSNVSCS